MANRATTSSSANSNNPFISMGLQIILNRSLRESHQVTASYATNAFQMTLFMGKRKNGY
jgi:hypothetical protein